METKLNVISDDGFGFVIESCGLPVNSENLANADWVSQQLEQTAKAALSSLQQRLQFSLTRNLQSRSQQLHGLSRMLHSVSPLPTLARGFAVVKDSSGKVVTSITSVDPGAQTITYLADGALLSEVKEVQQDVSITD